MGMTDSVKGSRGGSVRDDGPMQRLEAVKSDEQMPEVIFQKVCEGMGLGEIAKEFEIPKGKFVQWYTMTHGDLYDAGLKVHAADLALETLAISDGGVDVSRDRLRVDARKWVASKFDRARYGEAVKVDTNVSVGIDPELVDFASTLLAQMNTRPGVIGRVIVPEGLEATVTISPGIPELADPDEDVI